MRINQGISIVILALGVITIANFIEPLKNIELAGWFLLGAGLSRLNDYWGEKKK